MEGEGKVQRYSELYQCCAGHETVCRHRRKGREVAAALAATRRALEEWLQSRNRDIFDRYQTQCCCENNGDRERDWGIIFIEIKFF